MSVSIPPQDDRGALAGTQARLSLLHWPAESGSPANPPVLCLHGSPGSARNFEDLGPRLAAAGFEVWSLDLPGFGRSVGPVGGYSILAHARATLAAMDALGLERVHLVAWSMGGGVALHLADLAPQRVASIALIASIGVQEAEGSGSYAFEHAKYLALLGAFAAVQHAVPRFGALEEFLRDSRAFALNFWESDQRPLRDLMQRLGTPTLILSGQEDFLVPWWTAEVSHELISPSRLVVYDAGHFLPLAPPIGQADQVAVELASFFARHRQPGAPESRLRIEPDPPARGLRRFEPAAFALQRLVPWWLQVLAFAWLAARFRKTSGAVAGALVAAVQLDFGLAALATALGAAIGAAARERRRLRPATVWRACTAALVTGGWTLGTLVLCFSLQALVSSWLDRDTPRSAGPMLALALLGLSALALGRQRAWRASRAQASAVGCSRRRSPRLQRPPARGRRRRGVGRPAGRARAPSPCPDPTARSMKPSCASCSRASCSTGARAAARVASSPWRPCLAGRLHARRRGSAPGRGAPSPCPPCRARRS